MESEKNRITCCDNVYETVMFTVYECHSEDEMRACFPALSSHYPDLTVDSFMEFVRKMVVQGYRIIQMKSGDEVAGVAGFRLGQRLYCGEYIHIDNMIVAPNWRSKGVGRAIITWAKEEAKRLGCECVLADTYLHNDRAQAFFEREGFYKRGYHLKCDLND